LANAKLVPSLMGETIPFLACATPRTNDARPGRCGPRRETTCGSMTFPDRTRRARRRHFARRCSGGSGGRAEVGYGQLATRLHTASNWRLQMSTRSPPVCCARAAYCVPAATAVVQQDCASVKHPGMLGMLNA